jgi:hypothetical protein
VLDLNTQAHLMPCQVCVDRSRFSFLRLLCRPARKLSISPTRAHSEAITASAGKACFNCSNLQLLCYLPVPPVPLSSRPTPDRRCISSEGSRIVYLKTSLKKWMQGRRATVAVLSGKHCRVATAEKVVAGIETASEAAGLTAALTAGVAVVAREESSSSKLASWSPVSRPRR